MVRLPDFGGRNNSSGFDHRNLRVERNAVEKEIATNPSSTASILRKRPSFLKKGQAESEVRDEKEILDPELRKPIMKQEEVWSSVALDGGMHGRIGTVQDVISSAEIVNHTRDR